eukprot:SAG25_NODE_942_length_4661_cov_85.334064_3_plen_289_part_00
MPKHAKRARKLEAADVQNPGKAFTAYSPEQMAMLPALVRSRYSFVLLEPRGGYSHALGTLLLNSAAKQQQDETILAQLYTQRIHQAFESYALFVSNQDTGQSHIFPAFVPSVLFPNGSHMSPPSRKSIETITNDCYLQIKDEMEGDLLRRSPGAFISSDGTFHLCKVTMHGGRILIFLLGERGHIVAWYVVDSEAHHIHHTDMPHARGTSTRYLTTSADAFTCDNSRCTIVVSLYTYELGQNALLDRNSCCSLRELQLALGPLAAAVRALASQSHQAGDPRLDAPVYD